MKPSATNRTARAVTFEPSAPPPAAVDFLSADPVVNNVALSLLASGPGAHDGVGCAVETDAGIAGVAVQNDPRFPLHLSSMPAGCLPTLVDTLVTAAPTLSSVVGDPGGATRFATLWSEAARVAGHPTGAQRLHSICDRPAARVAAGRLRTARDEDRPDLRGWAAGLIADTAADRDPDQFLDSHLEAGRLWLWDDGEPRSMAVLTPATGRVTRISSVYTPPDGRGMGYASACVTGLVTAELANGADACVLYTDLDNPGPERMYRRLGFVHVADVLCFTFASTKP